MQEFDFNYLRERVIKIIRKLDESYTGEEETDTNSFRAVLLDTEESLAKALTGFEGQKVVALDTDRFCGGTICKPGGDIVCCDLKHLIMCHYHIHLAKMLIKILPFIC